MVRIGRDEMTDNTLHEGGLDWLLDDLVRRLPQADRAIVLSADGLLIGRSSNISRNDADHLSAVASGVQSLSRSAGRHFSGGAVHQTVVEMENSFLVVTAAGNAAYLALLAGANADMGMVAYEMNLLVRQVGTYLSSSPRRDIRMTEAGRGS
jgi:predicted regulator of Ras-like GTPase activity (Roadblock/LC7/MglB family)